MIDTSLLPLRDEVLRNEIRDHLEKQPYIFLKNSSDYKKIEIHNEDMARFAIYYSLWSEEEHVAVANCAIELYMKFLGKGDLPSYQEILEASLVECFKDIILEEVEKEFYKMEEEMENES
jgi:hypothetical protein